MHAPDDNFYQQKDASCVEVFDKGLNKMLVQQK